MPCDSGFGGVPKPVFKLAPPTTRNGGWTESVFVSFNGANGSNPEDGLIMDGVGNLYGITRSGGTNNAGTVFKLTNAGGTWTESVLYSFLGTTDGWDPYRGLVLNNGNLYGTTVKGGTYGAGTVYELTPSGTSWSETVLYSFEGGTPDGQSAIGPIFGTTPQTSGNLYGTTETGGANLAGTVFELTPNGTGGWNESIPHSFDGPAASQETFAGVIADASGNLYGTTELGGTSGNGTVFELTAAGAYSVLHSFSGPDGAGPFAGLLMDSSGNLYGTTVGGGAHTRGTVFKLTPPSVSGGSWTESVLWSFGGSVI